MPVDASLEPLLFSIPQIGAGQSLEDIADQIYSLKKAHVLGTNGSGLAAFLISLSQKKQKPIVVIADDRDSARCLYQDLCYHLAEPELNQQSDQSLWRDVLIYDAYDLGIYDEMVPDRRFSMARTVALFELFSRSDWRFLVLPADALLRRILPLSRFRSACLQVHKGQNIDREKIIRLLEQGGYSRAPVVEEMGTYAVRGGIIDVFVPFFGRPLRIDFFGDEVDNICHFSLETQRSEETLDQLWIHPARLSLLPQGQTQREKIKERLRILCDAVHQPTSQTERLIEDILDGRLFVGSDSFLPAYHKQLGSIIDYLPNDLLVCVDDPVSVDAAFYKYRTHAKNDYDFAIGRGQPAFLPEKHILSPGDVSAWLAGKETVLAHQIISETEDESDMGGLFYGDFDGQNMSLRCSEGDEDVKSAVPRFDINGMTTENLRQRLLAHKSDMDLLFYLSKYLLALVEEGYRVVIVSHTQGLRDRLDEMLKRRNIVVQDRLGMTAPGISLSVGELSRGCILPADGRCWVTEEEIFGKRSRRRKGVRPSKFSLNDLKALNPEDYVVHKEHGIGRYSGLVRQKIRDIEVDFLLVQYRDGDKLYLPVYRLNEIQKYQSSQGDDAKQKIRLDKLGGQTFSKKKAKAQKDAMIIAAKLLDLYAKREAATRPPVEERDELLSGFEAAFPFEETEDQASAIEDIMVDLERPRPMDRLVCGDVGFGKTEVAMRAAFRVVMSGRQVAVLVPTTVLAGQHYQGFLKRFEPYPVQVAVMSRFKSAKENSQTVMDVKNGLVDIVVGTHRLLSKDVHFKELGLLVIDEEHRFGVSHKERVRQLKASVDTIVLTATPIPRTLHMAFSGIRDLSLITTAPVDRRPIKTMVCHDDDNILKKAIERELSRDGQVFFVHNRVKDIERVAQRIQKWVPKARISIGHGQMKEAKLEKVMVDFVAGRQDILVCTSIIESGLDIPRANTIIVDRADTFGMAQLYQIRGRVGRSNVQAYAFLVVPPISMLGDEARKRVETLSRHTDLGSGFSVANMDLEIRGAGNLLGSEQSGNVGAVGFEMYCDLLNKAVNELKGEEVVAEMEPELVFENPGFFPETYIADVGGRLQLYKRLASAKGDSAVMDIKVELVDRYGPLPSETKTLLECMTVKAYCKQMRIPGIEVRKDRMVVYLGPDTLIDPTGLATIIKEAKGAVRMTNDLKLLVNFGNLAIDGAVAANGFLRKLSSYEIKTR